MGQCSDEIVAWVGRHVVPHEAALRAWLRRLSCNSDEINDIVQDAYLSIARLKDVTHIRNPRTYLFQAAKTAALMRLRRERVVRIERISEVDLLTIPDSEPSPERHVGARLELERVRRLISALPQRCRLVFEMRRIQGLPQKEIARRLNLPEHVVEAQAVRGLKLILKAIAIEDTMTELSAANLMEAERGAPGQR